METSRAPSGDSSGAPNDNELDAEISDIEAGEMEEVDDMDEVYAELDNVIAEMERLGPRRKNLWAARRGKPYEPLADNRRILIYEAFAAGIDYRQVGELAGIDPSVTHRWNMEWIEGEQHKTTNKTFSQLREELLALRGNRQSLDEQYEEVNERMKQLVRRGYELGMGLHQITRHSGVQRPSLRNWLGLKEGWVQKPREQ